MDIEERFQTKASKEEPILVLSIDDEPEGTSSTLYQDPTNATAAGDIDQETNPEASAFNVLSKKLGTIELAQVSIARDIEGLQHAFDSKIKYESGKDKIIDSLHTELQGYRDDLVFKILRPVLLDLIDMYNDLSNVLNHDGNIGRESNQAVNSWDILSTFQSTIVEVLARNGVEAFSEPGELFDPKKQRSSRIVDIDDPAKDRMVANRLRQGFVYGDRLLAHEQVVVYRYQLSSTTENATGEK